MNYYSIFYTNYVLKYQKISLSECLNLVSKVMKIPVKDLKSKSRSRKNADARFIYFKLANHFNYNNTQITHLVNRDRANVYNALNQIDKIPELQDYYKEVKRELIYE